MLLRLQTPTLIPTQKAVLVLRLTTFSLQALR